jgi:Kef-type K+ transport system membrane component KefB
MHGTEPVVFIMFVIFSGAAVLSTVALFTRQSLLVAYIILGALLGPWGLKILSNVSVITQTGEIGIIFLLFLLGLHLHPQNLISTLRKVSWVACSSSLVFAIFGVLVGLAFHFSLSSSLVIGAAMMFSSTIIGLKLLPTTVLHHQHTGELMISVLLMQDIIAIIVLLILQAVSDVSFSIQQILVLLLGFPVLIGVAYCVQRFVITKLIAKFDRIQEYVFMLSIGWCLSLAMLAHVMGLSTEIGAFIAGVSIAANPISLYIAESLKPLRDFFLVMFFFTVGAGFNFSYLPEVLLPAIILASFALLIKPCIFYFLFRRLKESKFTSWEVGWRLGQVSEFSLLVVFLAHNANIIDEKTLYLVEAATIFTFIVSCYVVVMRYPTPIALSDMLRKD